MKFLIVIIAFFIAATSYSQFTAVPLRLVNSDGSPNTGESANIKFTKYPHSYPTDIIGSITVTEIGTAGNYIAKGFTTFQYAKLWLSGVEQTWFDSVLTGNIFTYLQSNYGRLGSSNTWIGALNTFDGASFGGQVTLEDLTTVFNVEYSTESDLYLWAATPNNNTVIWRRYADSLYGEKKWWINGFKMRMLAGYKWYGSSSTIPAIPIDASEMTYEETTGLGVGTNQDSTVFPDVNIKYDSTDGSENLYNKTYNFYQPNYKNPVWDSLGGLKVEYERVTNGSVISEFEFHPFNNAWLDELEKSSNLTTSDAIIDTITLPRPGLYQITSVFTVNFANWNGSNCTDSVIVSIDDGSLPGSSRIASQIVTHRYNATVETGGAVNVTVTTLFYRQGQNNVIYLYGKLYNSTSAQTHNIWKTQTTAINIY